MPVKSNNFQGVSPVLLSSSCVVAANNSGIPSYDQLSYPFRKAIIIDEIRWTIRTNVEVDSNALNLGALVSARMQFGRHYLMRDAVPIWLLGTFMAFREEEEIDAMPDVARDYSNYRWKLPEPLYLEAGEVLRSTFSRGNDGFGPFTVQVTYVGRTVAPNQPRPTIIPVPYAAPWVTTLGNAYQQSNEFDLFNPFDVPLRIQRLTGRVLGRTTGFARSKWSLTPSTPGTSVTLLMNDSWGGKMVNNNTGPSDIFDVLRAAWTVDTEMPPKGVYEIRAWNIDNSVDGLEQVHVAMIGTREERL